jgi:D-xylose transport system ATP-binding protein
MSGPRILIMDDPTRGIDVGAKFEIYKIINDLTSQGVAVILISSELEEVIGMSDRIVVMCQGHTTATLEKDQFTQEEIMAYATGTRTKEVIHE